VRLVDALDGPPLTLDFNPRTREGCDFIAFGNVILAIAFQSTHP